MFCSFGARISKGIDENVNLKCLGDATVEIFFLQVLIDFGNCDVFHF
jgi:hypothetical protein